MMQTEVAKKLIEETFNQPYDLGRFKNFLIELTKGYEDKNQRPPVPDNFRDTIKSIVRIGKFADAKGEEIDLVAVTLQNDHSLDRARTLQRNYIARYLKVYEKDSALVAFVAPESGAWRFSLVRRELGIKLNAKGKTKTFDEISPARRFSFLVGKGEKTHTAKRQLMPLLEIDSKPSLASLEKAFNIETVTDEFFEEYRELFGTVEEQIDEHLKGDDKVKKHFAEKSISSADFAKRLLGQIVFLYFLQKKGWLGVPKDKKWGEGSKTFLRGLYEKAKTEQKNFFNDYLEPLFYETLNRDHSDNNHYSKLFDSRIPFLNGGLFDAYHDYDWHSVDIELPNEIFSKHGKSLFPGVDGVGILDVFDRYNFTVAEDEPLEREVAIDPEMLGKVFERLLPAGERGDKGTFYTPREIVHYMCQESLIAYLSSNIKGLDKTEVEDFIRYGDMMLEHDARVLSGDKTDTYKDVFLGKTIQDNLKAVDDALARVKVCDPAIGSGAFPVGMMSEIVRARKLLAVHRKKEVSNYDLKRDTIHNSLYGVDLDSGAIEIAKLRLWLSLVVDEDSFDNIQALPNLDYKIMQGNSLLQTYEGISLFKETLLKSHDNASRAKKKLQSEIDDLNATLRALGTMSTPVPPAQKRAIKEEIGKKEQAIKRFEKPATSKEASFFDADSKADELAEQLKKLHADFFRSASPSEKKKLRMRIEELEWQLIEASLKEQGKAGKLDEIKKLQKANVRPYFLWKLHFNDVFFGENGGFDIVIANPPYGADLTKSERAELKKGLVDTGNTNTAAVFIDQAKNLLINNTGTLSYIVPKSLIYSEKWLSLAKSLSLSVKHLVDVEKAFEDVKLEQVMFVYNKTFLSSPTYTGHKFKNSAFIRASEIAKSDFDYFNCWICDAGKQEITIARKLKSLSVSLGEISSTKRGLGLQKSISATGKYKVIGGKNISRYAINGARGYLAANLVEKSENKLSFLMQPKIISQDLIAHIENPKPHIKITSSFDADGNVVGLDTVQNTVIASSDFDPLFILGLLNSKLISWYTYNFIYCGAIRTMHFDNFYIGKIPVINVKKAEQKRLIELVKKISKKREESLENDISQELSEIDREVYKLYKLDATEIDIIESATKDAQKKAA